METTEYQNNSNDQEQNYQNFQNQENNLVSSNQVYSSPVILVQVQVQMEMQCGIIFPSSHGFYS